MEPYAIALIVGLVIAAGINFIGGSVRGIALTFVTMIYLAIISPMIPDRDVLGNSFYIVLIALEFSFICLALMIRSDATRAIVCISGYNLSCHFIGMVAYMHGYESASQYYAFLRVGETAQVASLICFTTPVARLAIWFYQRCREDENGYKLVAAPNS